MINSLNPTAGTNYNSFSALIMTYLHSSLWLYITVNVAAGTYSTPVTFTTIDGCKSATNSITIDGTDSSTTILTHNGATQYDGYFF